MRRVTRNVILAILTVVVLLLALGALPGYLGTGDPYYVTATPVDDDSEIEGVTTEADGGSENATNASDVAVPSANISERTYPFTTTALANASSNTTGQSAPYQTGPVGFKEAFTHSPFDEVNALTQQYPDARIGDGVAVSQNGTLYRVAVTR